MKPEALLEAMETEEFIALSKVGIADDSDALSREEDSDKLLFFEVFE